MPDESYAVGFAELPTPFVTEEAGVAVAEASPWAPEEEEASWATEEVEAEAPPWAPEEEEASWATEESEAEAHPILSLFPLPASVLDALGRGLWPSAISLASAAGYRDVNQLTNIVFYFRHPDMVGRKIRPDERQLAAEWISIRDGIVKPALQPAGPPAPAPAPAPTGGPPIPASRLRWQNATPDQVAFMRAVYEQHFANSKRRGRPFVSDLPDSALGTIYGRHRARADAAARARELLAAANAALAAQGLAGRIAVGIVSAYRPAQHQFTIWEGYGRRGGFPAYYRKAVSGGIIRGGDFSPDAVQKMARYIGQYIASPGFSNHQDGLAIDFGTGTAGRDDMHVISLDDWFHHWLVAKAKGFGFEPYVKEAWHWVYRGPARSEAEEWSGEVPSTGVRPGRLEVAHVPMLAGHRGNPPDLVLRWNAMPPQPAEVDVVVHLHGYSRNGMRLPRDIEPWSGLDLAPVDSATGSGRARPTLTVLSRGHNTGQQTASGLYRYTFPALVGAEDVQRLVDVALDRFAAELGVPRPRLGRLILTAHSGGGAPLMRILHDLDPHEVHVFDGLYQDAGSLAAWALRRMRADRAGSPAGALRVFFRGPTAGYSRRLLAAVSGELRADNADRYRVEASTLGHWQIPRRYGWRILADAGADAPDARREPVRHREEEEDEGLDESMPLTEVADFEDPAEAEETEVFEEQPVWESYDEEAPFLPEAGDEAAPFEGYDEEGFETEAFDLGEAQLDEAFESAAEVATLAESEGWFDRATGAIRDAVDFVKTRVRIANGVRDVGKLTNLVFFDRHPERGGRSLVPGEPDFAALRDEWRAIRDTVVRPALSAATAPVPRYDRAGAIAYARKFWLQPCDDGFVALGPSAGKNFAKVPAGTVFVHEPGAEHALLPDGTKIPWIDLDDCTHFISCCIGQRPGERCGGLNITIRQLGSPPTAPFGIVRVSTMVDFLVRNKLAKVVAEKSEDDTNIDKLEPGDLVAYWNKKVGRYSHMALVLPGKKIACHTYCRSDQPACTWDNDWDLGRGDHSWTFLHIVA